MATRLERIQSLLTKSIALTIVGAIIVATGVIYLGTSFARGERYIQDAANERRAFSQDTNALAEQIADAQNDIADAQDNLEALTNGTDTLTDLLETVEGLSMNQTAIWNDLSARTVILVQILAELQNKTHHFTSIDTRPELEDIEAAVQAGTALLQLIKDCLVNTSIDYRPDLGVINTSLGSGNTLLGQIDTSLGSSNTLLGQIRDELMDPEHPFVSVHG